MTGAETDTQELAIDRRSIPGSCAGKESGNGCPGKDFCKTERRWLCEG